MSKEYKKALDEALTWCNDWIDCNLTKDDIVVKDLTELLYDKIIVIELYKKYMKGKEK